MALENFTDVDDKIIEKQKEFKKDWRMIAQEHIDTYLWACDELNIQRATFYPRASQHIEEIINLVELLIQKGFAYEKKGDVYFRVRRFPDYGRLSKKSIDDLMAGARIAPTDLKDDPLDFALWKRSKPDEPYWLSPWGKGRPGWHIECSAMSMRYLGETFDIHTGGEDLIFPHHENEIAQSIAATGKPFARFWLHNGWVTLTGEKMSKSTGHYSPIKEVLQEYSANVIRMFMLKTHYRKQLEYASERLDEAKSALDTIRACLDKNAPVGETTKPMMIEEFTGAMNNDLNTSGALGVVHELINKGYETGDPAIAASVRYYFSLLGFKDEVLREASYSDVMRILSDVRVRLQEKNEQGMLDSTASDFLRMFESEGVGSVRAAVIRLLLSIRERLRDKKDFELADYIRNRLRENHIIVDDQNTGGSTYRVEVQ